MEAAFEYRFPAIRGVQAGREYYVSMCPMRLIPKLFSFDDEELVPELRAQRVLNRGRVPEMAEYVVKNKDNYVFSALTASVDGSCRFEPLGEDSESSRVGALCIDMNAKFVINDGQHRRAAIEAALRESPELGDETISVVFFHDRGLERCQQMFADLNRYAIRPATSLSVLYDHRDDKARLTKLVVWKSEAFATLVEMERSTLSARSRKLFTLSSIYHANSALLSGKPTESIEDAAQDCIDYWDEVAKYMPEWKLVQKSKLSAGDVRKDFIHSHSVVLQALGKVGNELFDLSKLRRSKHLKLLEEIDWSRANARLWEGRAMNGGRVTKSGHNVTLTLNVIKKAFGLPLSDEQSEVEASFLKGEYSNG